MWDSHQITLESYSFPESHPSNHRLFKKKIFRQLIKYFVCEIQIKVNDPLSMKCFSKWRKT